MTATISILKPALILFVLMTIITGIIYPLGITVLAQVFFAEQAEGSLVHATVASKDVIVGSKLLGQTFVDKKYFWSRPSATSPAYNAAASSGSNFGPTNKDYLSTIEKRCSTFTADGNTTTQTANNTGATKIPVDIVTASGSGLDPDISPAAALAQVNRVATARSISSEKVKELLAKYTQERQLGFLGERRVNVLQLNMALDKLQ